MADLQTTLLMMQGAKQLTFESLHQQLGLLRAEMPDLSRPQAPEVTRWLGRAVALVEAAGATVELAALRVELMSLDAFQSQTVQKSAAVALILDTVLARLELKLPVQSQGAFIPAGGAYEAFQAVGKAVSLAKENVLMVDPYADAVLLSDFAVQVPAGILVRILSDAATLKTSLEPAARRWVAQFGATRPLEVRKATDRALHDRLIIVDEKLVWVLGQSFKDLAKRAHSSLVRMDSESAELKVDAYKAMWDSASALA